MPHALANRTGAWPGRRARCLAALSLVALVLAPLPATAQSAVPAPAHGRAQTVTKADALAIRATVQRQFDAFEKDDAAAAFALASSRTRLFFGSPEKFLAVVKAQYQAVYRHRVAFFTGVQRIDGSVIQSVRLTDADDRVWVALYRLERESDGRWHILDCELLQTTSVST